MKIDLRKLYGIKNLDIDEDITVPEETYTKMNVKSMDAYANGTISVNYESNIEINLDISGTFTMPCEITNEDVLIPFKTNVEEEILENSLNDEFFLDLSDILWENIVLEIPFRVIKEGAKLEAVQGEGWELSTEE